MRDGGHIHLEINPGDASQSFAVLEDFPGNLIRTAHHERTVRSQESVKVGAGDRGPTAFPTDLRERTGVTGKEILRRLFGRGGDITMGKKEEAIEQFKLIFEMDASYKDVGKKVDDYYAGQ